MRIEKFQIKNFHCCENIKLVQKENYTVLVGINGSGKTIILDVLSVAL